MQQQTNRRRNKIKAFRVEGFIILISEGEIHHVAIGFGTILNIEISVESDGFAFSARVKDFRKETIGSHGSQKRKRL